MDAAIALFLIVTTFAVGVHLGMTLADARRDKRDAEQPPHLCSYGCGTPTWSCALPCPQCKADEAEQDALRVTLRGKPAEDRLLAVVRLSEEQVRRRDAGQA